MSDREHCALSALIDRLRAHAERAGDVAFAETLAECLLPVSGGNQNCPIGQLILKDTVRSGEPPGAVNCDQDRLDLRHPGEHARAGLVVGDVLLDGGGQFPHMAPPPTSQPPGGQLAEPAFNEIQLRTAGWNDAHVEAGMTREPSPHCRMRMGGVVVHDEVQRVGRWCLLVKPLEELQGKVKAPVFVAFMTWLLKQLDGRLYLIMDRHPVHKSSEARRVVDQHKPRLRLIRMPGYCPELNPDELLNQDVKTNGLGKSRPTSRTVCMASVRSHWYQRQKQPQVISNLFREEQVR